MAKKVKQSSVMDQLAAYRPPWEEPVKEEGDSDDKATIKTLTERIAALEKDRTDSQQRELVGRFQNQQVAAPVAEATQKKSFFEGLPDPVKDFEGFTAELEKRNQAQLEARLAQLAQGANAEREHERAVNDLWSGFQKNHPEWAEHEMLVNAAANRVSAGMQARGIDVGKLVRAAPEAFNSEVAGLLDKEYPQLKGEKEAEEDEGEANRTAGVFGGTFGKGGGGGDPAAAPRSMEEDNALFLRGIAEIQHKSGHR